VLTPTAIGRIDSKKAVAISVLRRKLVRYWEAVRRNRSRQAWFDPEELVPDFVEFATAVFDAAAEEHLAVSAQSPQQFLQFLRDDLTVEMWGLLQGDAGVWRSVVDDSLTLSNFAFPRVPVRSIRKEDFRYPHGKERFEAALRDRVDAEWTTKARECLGASDNGNATSGFLKRQGIEDSLRTCAGEPSELFAASVFGTNRPVTLVRYAGTPRETRWQTRMGGDFVRTALFLAQDKVEIRDEIHCDAFDEPRVISRVDPVVVNIGISHWNAGIEPRSEWRRRHDRREATASRGLLSQQRTMYHATKPPVTVNTARQENELGPEWSRAYIHQSYPKVKHHWNGRTVTVQSLEAEVALGGGWSNSTAFEPYKGPRRARPDRSDPVKWLDGWYVPGLTAEFRIKIKAQLKRAHGLFWKAPDTATAVTDSMRQAFDGIAQVLFDAGILTEEVLGGALTALVWDSAIAGGWWHLASETPQSIFPEQLGHYWVWRDDSQDWTGLFMGEIAEWESELLEASAESQSSRAPGARKAGKKRGRRADVRRRNAIHDAISAHGDEWRDHLSEILNELENREVRLGDFQTYRIDLGDGQSSSVSTWDDLDLAEGEQRALIIDALRKYID
jgi:hypothetical protein